MFIVITGNPGEGFTYHGPFDDLGAATRYAEQFDGDWWTARLHVPFDADRRSPDEDDDTNLDDHSRRQRQFMDCSLDCLNAHSHTFRPGCVMYAADPDPDNLDAERQREALHDLVETLVDRAIDPIKKYLISWKAL